jgi:hypothetical protein
MISLLMASCEANSKTKPIVSDNQTISDVRSSMVESTNKIGNNTKIIDNAVVNIDHHTDVATSSHPDNADLISYSDLVAGEASKIKEANNSTADVIPNLISDSKNLQKVDQKIKDLTNKIVDLENEKGKLQNEAVKNIYSYLGIIFAIGTLTVIAGAALAFFINPRSGLFVCGLGLIGLAVAAGATYYLKVVALVGIIGVGAVIVGIIGYIVYVAIRQKKEVKVLTTATEETVNLVEKIKDQMPVEKKLEIFGTNMVPGKAQEIIKSESSRKIIDKIRKSTKNKAVSHKPTAEIEDIKVKKE